MAIPQTFIQDLLTRSDVVEVVGRFVQLKKSGANFMGLCPFHSEKSPSFTVSPSKQFFHCFGCGKNGNAIGFLIEHAGMNFVEAVKDLAQSYGMQVPEETATPQDRERAQEQRQKQATLNDVLEKAGESYRKHLRQSEQAVAYLKGRGLTGEIAKKFGLGFAPAGWRNLASVFADYQDPLLVESGLVISNDEDPEEEKRYDRFRDRIMFPIRNIKGECIGFGGRVLGDGSPKYLNSPETPVFSKGRELYGLFEARQALREAGYVLVTEGYMDVVALAQLGFPQAVATLGTACTYEHVQKLFRFTDSVMFSFDGDAAGQRAARKALEGALSFATDVRSVKFLFLPEEHDPDSFIRANGSEAFAHAITEAIPLSRFLIDVCRNGCDMETAEGRAHFASIVQPLWQQLPSGVLKTQLLQDIAQLVQISNHELLKVWGVESIAKLPNKFSRSSTSSFKSKTSRLNLRRTPASRQDRALHILFADMTQWDGLPQIQKNMLCELPSPHGPLFSWLDQQLHEFGILPLAALVEALRGHPEEASLKKQIELTTPDLENDSGELQSILLELEKSQVAQLLNELTRQASADPRVYERIKLLNTRLVQLKTGLSKA
ncbi:MAG: DNA primase [Limnohabitans sp.]|nr:DNA primase [Limnohabitans sp.]